MTNLKSAINNTVSISAFNRGEAGKIFKDVKENGPKVVMKNNIAECILLSPQEYNEMMEAIEDAELLAIARERLEHFDPDKLISEEEMMKEFGITEDMLDAMDEVDFE